MTIPDYSEISIPSAPRGIAKGFPVKNILNENALGYMARNLMLAWPEFPAREFVKQGREGLEDLSLMARSRHIADVLFRVMPGSYEQKIERIIRSMPPPSDDAEEFGLATLFFMPYGSFIAQYGMSAEFNEGRDPFDTAMRANRELTLRFSAEFSIRPFLVHQQERTLSVIHDWLSDPSNHVRRLCSEGTRPKLPWGINLPALIKDPRPILPIVESLKNDPSLYVRRSVANNLGDIAKDHPELVFELCAGWLKTADADLRWVIRHALRYPAKKGQARALELRQLAKA